MLIMTIIASFLYRHGGNAFTVCMKALTVDGVTVRIWFVYGHGRHEAAQVRPIQTVKLLT